jgi:hypothetical protein
MHAVGNNTLWAIVIPAAVLVIGLLAGMFWVMKVVGDLKNNDGKPADTPKTLLSPLEQAFAAGQMSEEEYLKIRSAAVKVAGGGDLLPPIRDPLKPRKTQATVARKSGQDLPPVDDSPRLDEPIN